jgi:hypothetical protein
LGRIVLPTEKNPAETIISVQKLSGNKTKSVIGSTSKMSHLPDVFVVGKATYGPTCVFGGISPQMSENHVDTRITAKLTGYKVQSLFTGQTEKVSIYQVFSLLRRVNLA